LLLLAILRVLPITAAAVLMIQVLQILLALATSGA
jgi:hypothetical protein